MNVRTTAVGTLACVALIAGCSARSDYEASEVTTEPSDTGVYHWIREGVRLARATKARDSSIDIDDGLRFDPSVFDQQSDKDALPSRDLVVPLLVEQGLTTNQANCIYDGVSSNAQVATDVSAIIDGLAASATADPNAPFDPSSLGSLASLTPDSTNRLMLAALPCLDGGAIAGLLGGGGVGSLDDLLSSANGLDLSALASLDGASIAAAIAGSLGSDQIAQVEALISAVTNAQSGLANTALLNLDLANLDLSTLPTDQLPLIALAFFQGLTGAQQGQLLSLAGINPNLLTLNISPDDLSSGEMGGLLSLLLPLLTGAINPTQPNALGGLDLSTINPLIFLDRAEVVSQFQQQGVDGNIGGCLFDNISRMTAAEIAALFTPDASPDAVIGLLFVSLGCVLQGA